MSKFRIMSVVSLIMTFVVLVSFISGCGKAAYDKKIDAYVLVKETDDIHIDDEMIESFMSEYYKDSGVEFSRKSPEDKDSGIAASFTVSKGQDGAFGNDDRGVCIVFDTAKKAKEEWQNFFLPNFSIVSEMQCFCVRIEKYVFVLGAELWKPFFDHIGIPLEKKSFSVADYYDVTYEKAKKRNLDELFQKLKDNKYSVREITGWGESYSVVSENGDATYTVIAADYLVKDFKRNRNHLKASWFVDDDHGVLTCDGLTVYGYKSFVVISRGNSWAELLNQIDCPE